ncbi:hypothetical protein LTR49_028883, partial [Elasticomyces elasticus]
MYVAWFQDCRRRLAIEQNKPLAKINLDEECIAVSLDWFRWRRLQQYPKGSLEQKTIISAAFQYLVIERLQKSDHCNLPSLTDIEEAVAIGWNQRKKQGKLWTETESSKIIDAYLVHSLTDGTFSITDAISPSNLASGLEHLVALTLLDANLLATAISGAPTAATYLACWTLEHREKESWPLMKFEQHSPSCYS